MTKQAKSYPSFDEQPDSDDLKEAKRLYDVMFEARTELEKFRGMKANAPKADRIAVGDAIIKLRAAEVALAQHMKHIDIVDNSKLHRYGRQKQGLKV